MFTPARAAASMSISPGLNSASLPFSLKVGTSVSSGRDVVEAAEAGRLVAGRRDLAGAMPDVVRELVGELLDVGPDGNGCRVRERADGAPVEAVGDADDLAK